MFLIQSKCRRNAPSPSFLEINFFFKNINFCKEINAYQEGTEINTEVNERPLRILVRIGI